MMLNEIKRLKTMHRIAIKFVGNEYFRSTHQNKGL